MSLPVLFTERLILRPLAAEDFEDWARFHADETVMRFLGGVVPRSVAWRGLCAMAGAWSIRGFSMFSQVERDSGRWVGRAGPWRPEGWPGTEVGWGVLPEFAGKGFAFEAATAAIDYAIDVLHWEDVMHSIDPGNAPSIALARRLGAANRGPTRLPPPFESDPVDNWGQSASAWRARRSAGRN
ncbi:GNAT family N-acetyltransferase [Sphingomonas sp.]|uniref:GNAT family N-acetyltransferase n=1 Tax=Sphingomonas sp. TaxID=28214 RepID=UPI003D6CF9F8